jgi:Fe-S-cluster containining protein
MRCSRQDDAIHVETAPEYDCLACGACCFSPWTGDGYVAVDEAEATQLSRLALPVIHQVQGDGQTIAKLGTRIDSTGRACVAFRGSVGRACACGIYDLRPQPCRQFEMGSIACRQARQRFALPI